MLYEKYIGKKNNLFSSWAESVSRPNLRGKTSPLQLSLSTITAKWAQGASGAHLSASPLCVEPTYWGISPSNSPTRTCSSRRRQSTAAARPSGHLGACRHCCRATPPVRMPQAALSPRTTELSLRATAQRARCCACYAAMVPGASRSTTPSCSAHCRNLLPLPCARRLDAELSARARVGPLHSLHLPRTCHRVAASA
jgi:hypothetical protein